jgi:nucleotide-binding universal stress UspA family protein
LKYAKSEEIDLIIIDTHGRKALEKILFGSVIERVIEMSPHPLGALTLTGFRLRGLL